MLKQRKEQENSNKNAQWLAMGGAFIAGAAAFLSLRFKIATPSQYIVRTGLGISDINITKKAIVWPFQTFDRLDIAPRTFSFVLHAMSREKMEFQLPVQFTIGPYNDVDRLKTYSVRLSSLGREKLEELVKGIIEGGTRGLAANLSIEEIFSDRIKFKSDIKASVQHDLDQFGLLIFNANIKEMVDAEGSEYFVFLRQKTKENAINQAKIEVAEARLKGDVGEKERVGMTRREVSKIESETKVYENEREQETKASEAALEQRKAQFQRDISIAQIESAKAAAIRESELQKQVELKRLEQETERLRAEKLSESRVYAETVIQEAEGQAQAKQRMADADMYAKQKEAAGILSIYEAQAEGLRKLYAASGSDFKHVLQYLMVERELYSKLAAENAKAIQGLQPKITVWNTSGATGTDSPTKVVRDLFQAIPPLVSTIEEQTGIKPPSWLLSMPPNHNTVSTSEPIVKQ